MLAALRAGIKTVIIPEKNVKDLEDIPEEIKGGLKIIPVKNVDQVLDIALEYKPVPIVAPVVAEPAITTEATANTKISKIQTVLQ